MRISSNPDSYAYASRNVWQKTNGVKTYRAVTGRLVSLEHEEPIISRLCKSRRNFNII